MKRITVLVMILALLPLSLHLSAEDTIGCSKGIGKGVIWPRLNIKVMNFTEKWSRTLESMVAMDSDDCGLQDASIRQLDFRLGYGLLHNLNVGVNLKYSWGEADKINSAGKFLSLSERDLTQIWFSGQWFFMDTHAVGPLKHFKLGLGASYGIPLNDTDENLLAGMGPGVGQFKLGPMWHFELGSTGLELAGHALYQWKGTAREVQGWGRSGHNIADTLNYQFKFEYTPFNFMECGAGLTGWIGMEDDMSLKNLDGSLNKGYNHSVMVHAEIFFMGDQYEKRKIFFIMNVPYAQRAMKTAPVVWTLGVMWTFYTF